MCVIYSCRLNTAEVLDDWMSVSVCPIVAISLRTQNVLKVSQRYMKEEVSSYPVRL